MNEFLTSLTDKLSSIFDPELIGSWLADAVVNLLIAVSVFAVFIWCGGSSNLLRNPFLNDPNSMKPAVFSLIPLLSTPF